MVSRGQDQWVVLRPHSLFTALHAKVPRHPPPQSESDYRELKVVVLSLHTRAQLKDKFAYAVKRQNLRVPKGCATTSPSCFKVRARMRWKSRSRLATT
jgi:hypothetical protein